MIIKIIDIIEEKTLIIIIDEPESHLHPPLLANFIKALSYILKEINGGITDFDTFATYSKGNTKIKLAILLRDMVMR